MFSGFRVNIFLARFDIWDKSLQRESGHISSAEPECIKHPRLFTLKYPRTLEAC